MDTPNPQQAGENEAADESAEKASLPGTVVVEFEDWDLADLDRVAARQRAEARTAGRRRPAI